MWAGTESCHIWTLADLGLPDVRPNICPNCRTLSQHYHLKNEKNCSTFIKSLKHYCSDAEKGRLNAPIRTVSHKRTLIMVIWNRPKLTQNIWYCQGTRETSFCWMNLLMNAHTVWIHLCVCFIHKFLSEVETWCKVCSEGGLPSEMQELEIAIHRHQSLYEQVTQAYTEVNRPTYSLKWMLAAAEADKHHTETKSDWILQHNAGCVPAASVICEELITLVMWSLHNLFVWKTFRI